MKLRIFCSWIPVFAICAGLGSPVAFAQSNAVEDARILFEAGATAYAAGRYADAVSAFREAYALTPDRPAVLFSLAQAERRQFIVDRNRETLDAAISHFRRYLELVVEGGRRGDVVVALGELEAMRASMESRPEVVRKPRIFVTTDTPAATIFIDGVKRDKIPVIEEIAAGKHVVTISAPGFVEESREVTAVDGTVFPIEIKLKEKPSFLAVDAPRGASILIDGRAYGDAPLVAPVEVSSGNHVISVTQRGYVPFAKQITLQRGSTLHTNVPLALTTQRRISYVLFGSAIVSFGTGIVLAAAASSKDSQAEDIYNRAKRQNIDQVELAQYTSTLESRNILIGGSISAILIATGVTFAAVPTYWFDSPSTPQNATFRTEARLSLTPLPSGGFLSVGTVF